MTYVWEHARYGVVEYVDAATHAVVGSVLERDAVVFAPFTTNGKRSQTIKGGKAEVEAFIARVLDVAESVPS